MRRSHSVGSLSSPPVVIGYEWVRDDVLKYKSSLTSATSVTALQCQVKLASPEDSWKIVIQACDSDDFPFLRVALGSPPFFFMYKCLFEVMGLILPLIVFQCALLEHLNVAPS